MTQLRNILNKLRVFLINYVRPGYNYLLTIYTITDENFHQALIVFTAEHSSNERKIKCPSTEC